MQQAQRPATGSSHHCTSLGPQPPDRPKVGAGEAWVPKHTWQAAAAFPGATEEGATQLGPGSHRVWPRASKPDVLCPGGSKAVAMGTLPWQPAPPLPALGSHPSPAPAHPTLTGPLSFSPSLLSPFCAPDTTNCMEMMTGRLSKCGKNPTRLPAPLPGSPWLPCSLPRASGQLRFQLHRPTPARVRRGQGTTGL